MTAMAGWLSRPCMHAPASRLGATACCALGLLVSHLAAAADSATAGPAGAAPLAAATSSEQRGAFAEDEQAPGISTVRPAYGPPGEIPGIPSDATLEAEHAVIGAVVIDNQNIFDPNDPKDNTAPITA